MYLLSFVLISFIFLLKSSNILLRIILLEIITFITLFICSFSFSHIFLRDFLIISLFSIFVIEGVIALSGLISLVTTTGSDRVRSSSLLKF